MNERERRGPSGEIELSYVHQSSHNGAEDDYSSAKLVCDGDRVILVAEHSYDSAWKPSDDGHSKNQYAIPAKQLIELIKANGERLPRGQD